MKKILLFLIMFFIFVPTIYADGVISKIDVNVNIEENGIADVTEIWSIEKQEEMSYIEKNFKDMEDVIISDVSVSSNRNVEIKQVEEWDKTQKNTYYFRQDSDAAKLLVAIDGENDTYTLSYKVEGFIVDFKDVQGIDWYFLTTNTNQKVNSFSARILSNIGLFTEKNTALYAIGNETLEASFTDGAIFLQSSSVNSNYPIKLMTTFNGFRFKKTVKKTYTFDDRYKSEMDSNNFNSMILDFISGEIFYILIMLIGIIIAFLILKYIYKALKKHDDYYGINVPNKEIYTQIENANYYDATPCNGDLYKIAFIAGYFKLLKNRSDLIGALILKWDFEKYLDIVANSNNPYIKLRGGQYFDNALDYDLYNILTASASGGILGGSKLTRYASEHYLRVMAWFNMGHHDTINNELNKGTITRVKKLKKYELVLQQDILDDAIRLAGLKKYLLHFNQVPRSTQLTNEGYKYLLIAAELLGIGEQVSKEILRKNPDNEMAQKLADLQKLKHIYKNVYSSALAPYKQVVKGNANNTSYDPEIESIVKRDTEAVKNRRF